MCQHCHKGPCWLLSATTRRTGGCHLEMKKRRRPALAWITKCSWMGCENLDDMIDAKFQVQMPEQLTQRSMPKGMKASLGDNHGACCGLPGMQREWEQE